MHAVTSNYKRTEQNRGPLSDPSLVMASYSLFPNYYERQEFTIMFIPRNSEAEVPSYSIATACPSCSRLHIHMAALPRQLLRASL